MATVLSILLCLAYCTVVLSQSCSIGVKNGGFSLMVGIAEDVTRSRSRGDRHDYRDLKASLEEKLTQASMWLYRATRNRAYFSDITVVVPDAWSSDASFQCARQCETYERAKIKIRQPRIDGRGRELHGAYVIPGRCGEEGMLMHLTASRMASASHQASPAEKMFVHEFAHLRYGVGDEYYQSVFGLGADGKPSACSVKVEPLRSRTTGRYSGFNPNGASASFMWHQFRPNVMSFCDDSSNSDTRHNRGAANSHNQRCNRQSVWEVLNKSPDFCCGRNPPLRLSESSLPPPKFRFVRKCQGGCEVVAVDVSASMTGRMMEVQQAAAGAIDAASPSTNIALISFADNAHLIAPLQTATSAYKDFVKRSLPDERAIRLEHTSIVNGLRLARQLLGSPSCQQKRITILSDCGETSSEEVTSATVLMLQQNGIQLNSLTFDDNAPKCMLPMLSRVSEGSTCNQGDMLASDAAMSDCMAPTAAKDIPSSEHRPHFAMTAIPSSERVCYDVCIEPEIGRNTRFSISWNVMTTRHQAEKLWFLISPSSRHFNHKHANYTLDEMHMMSSIGLMDTEPGIWEFCIRNRLPQTATFTSNVNTQMKEAVDGLVCPISAAGHLSSMVVEHPNPQLILVEVTKCNMPVLDALVTCNVTRPSSPPATVMLRDDGMGDDDMANDGIYTGTFSRYMGDGQYNVHCAASCQRNNAVDHDHEIVTMVRNAPKRMDDAGEEQDQLMTGMSMDYPDNDRDMATNMDHCCFVRHLSLGAFTVTGFEKKKMQVLERDMVPPAAVHDLRQVSVNTDVYPYQVTLQFSTTGDDMETGNAMSYDIRWSAMFEALDRMFNNSMIPTVLDNPDPLRYPPMKTNDMVPETVTVRLEVCLPAKANNMVLFAVKALDEEGNVSPLSNVVRVEFPDKQYMSRCPPGDLMSDPKSQCCLNTAAFMATPPSPLDWDNEDPEENPFDLSNFETTG